MNLEALKISSPKGTWPAPATLALIEEHNIGVDLCTADLAQLRQEVTSYVEGLDVLGDVQAAAVAKSGMMTRLLAWYQSTLRTIRGRGAVASKIIAEAQQERGRVLERLAARRQEVNEAMKAAGVVGGSDPEAERLDTQARTLLATGPAITPVAIRQQIEMVEKQCVEALRAALTSGLPTLPQE